MRVDIRSWWRVHQLANDPLYFGRTGRNRFDAPAGEYGVLYAGDGPHCAFIETFGHLNGTQIVARAELAARGLARVDCHRALRLIDLAGPALSGLLADARLTMGDDYRLAQRWALALYQHPTESDGLVYRSRHDPSRLCLALYDRAAPAVAAVTLGSLAEPHHAALLAGILDDYHFGLV